MTPSLVLGSVLALRLELTVVVTDDAGRSRGTAVQDSESFIVWIGLGKIQAL
jgi:hypothetical protein